MFLSWNFQGNNQDDSRSSKGTEVSFNSQKSTYFEKYDNWVFLSEQIPTTVELDGFSFIDLLDEHEALLICQIMSDAISFESLNSPLEGA